MRDRSGELRTVLLTGEGQESRQDQKELEIFPNSAPIFTPRNPPPTKQWWPALPLFYPPFSIWRVDKMSVKGNTWIVWAAKPTLKVRNSILPKFLLSTTIWNNRGIIKINNHSIDCSHPHNDITSKEYPKVTCRWWHPLILSGIVQLSLATIWFLNFKFYFAFELTQL